MAPWRARLPTLQAVQASQRHLGGRQLSAGPIHLRPAPESIRGTLECREHSRKKLSGNRLTTILDNLDYVPSAANDIRPVRSPSRFRAGFFLDIQSRRMLKINNKSQSNGFAGRKKKNLEFRGFGIALPNPHVRSIPPTMGVSGHHGDTKRKSFFVPLWPTCTIQNFRNPNPDTCREPCNTGLPDRSSHARQGESPTKRAHCETRFLSVIE